MAVDRGVVARAAPDRPVGERNVSRTMRTTLLLTSFMFVTVFVACGSQSGWLGIPVPEYAIGVKEVERFTPDLSVELHNLTDANWTVRGSNRRLCPIVVYRA